MKVLILSVGDQRNISLISLYTEYFDKNNISYELVCMNRYGSEQIKYNNCKQFLYNCKIDSNWPKYKKIKPFINFRKFAKNIIKKNHYDFIVVWGENTMFLFSDYLIKSKIKYCANIRDVDYPKNILFKKLFDLVIKKASFVTWCVPRKPKFFEKYALTTMLSQNLKVLKNCNKKKELQSKNSPIRISWIGKLQYPDEDKKIIKAFGNDDRYIIQYFGMGAENLKGFVDKNNYKNVHLYGTFAPEETGQFLEMTDVINAYYGTETYQIEYASPIKFGYSSYLYIPALVTPNTYLADVIKKYKFGFVASNLDTLADDFYNWYHNNSFKKLKKECEKYNDYIKKTNDKFYNICDKNFK